MGSILVIGGSRGIGGYIGDQLGRNHHVIRTYKTDRTTLKQESNWMHLDLNDLTSIESFVEELPLNISAIIFNAGINARGDFLEMTPEDYDNVMNVNLKSYVFLVQGIEKAQKLRDGMRLIFISSVSSQYYGPTTCHYMLSKIGINGLVKFLAQRYSTRGILVNGIAPGLIRTDQTDSEFESGAAQRLINRTLLRRPGTLEEVFGTVEYLLEQNSTYLTGQIIALSGGAIL